MCFVLCDWVSHAFTTMPPYLKNYTGYDPDEPNQARRLSSSSYGRGSGNSEASTVSAVSRKRSEQSVRKERIDTQAIEHRSEATTASSDRITARARKVSV